MLLRELGFREKVKGAESRWWDSRVAPWRAWPWRAPAARTDGHLWVFAWRELCVHSAHGTV